MDNLRAHKVPGVREAIEKAQATVRYLPKYSPDLNPIEMPYSKFKALLRKFAECIGAEECAACGLRFNISGIRFSTFRASAVISTRAAGGPGR